MLKEIFNRLLIWNQNFLEIFCIYFFLNIYVFFRKFFVHKICEIDLLLNELSRKGVTCCFLVLQSITAKLAFSFNSHLPVILFSIIKLVGQKSLELDVVAKYGKVTRQS
jgi:hypothetical protein